MIFVVSVLAGILLGILVPYNLSSSTLPYVAVAIIAALDSVFGGLAANLNKRFNMSVFMIGLISNAILAVVLTFMGDVLGINLYFAAIVVFGVRMFNNMGTIRRLTIDIHFERRAREHRHMERLALREAAEESEDDGGIDAEKITDLEEKREDAASDAENTAENAENDEKDSENGEKSSK